MRYRVVMLLPAILLLIFSMTGCGTGRVVAEVNRAEITRTELDEYMAIMKLFVPQIDEMADDESYWAAVESDMLNFLIETALVRQEVERLSLSIDEERVRSLTAESKVELVDKVYGSEEDLAERMNLLDIDDTALEKMVRAGLQNEILFEHVTDGITEQDLRDYAAENPEILVRPAYIDASHILVETEGEAEEVIERLRAGDDFAELAGQVSIDENAEHGGVLGRIFEGDPTFDSQFIDAAFALEEGEISDPVETAYGYHIIKVTGKEEAREQTFEEAKEEIREQKNRILYEEYFANLWDTAEIKTFLD